jgi:hypothetical protein
MVAQLHVALAYLSLGLAILVALDAGWRAWRGQGRGQLGERLDAGLLIAIGVGAAGGLGIYVGGGRPAEDLHFVYAVLALGALPVASSIARGRSQRQVGVARLTGAVIAVVLIARLFQTG